ncbi:unnamed protein product, partial [Phaeothamnion confervicola]
TLSGTLNGEELLVTRRKGTRVNQARVSGPRRPSCLPFLTDSSCRSSALLFAAVCCPVLPSLIAFALVLLACFQKLIPLIFPMPCCLRRLAQHLLSCLPLPSPHRHTITVCRFDVGPASDHTIASCPCGTAGAS